MAITTQNLRPYLQQCGYSNDLIREDYIYSDSSGCEHRAPIVGFAYPSYDCRNACITAIDAELLEAPDFESKAICCRDIGTPLLFICCRKELQWWSLTSKGVEFKERVPINQIDHFFKQHYKEFSPESIYRAKNLGRVNTKQQLEFVDIGLTPLLEHEMGERLGELMNRVLNLLRKGFTERQLEKREIQRWIFRAGFWLLCAKILQDKKVPNFIRLDLNDIDKVIRAVSTHYGAKEKIEISTKKQRNVLENAAKEVDNFSSLQNLTTEAFGYMYENVLVSKDLRTALGIHATPSYLVDYIVWQLWPWIQQMPEDKRVVLEPTSGHAPFLTGALRVLRELFDGDAKEFHKYAKKNLIGVEVDPFAQEIARLSLTLADVPNSNGWKISERDIYHDNTLRQQAAKSMILLSNPPFENFSPDEQAVYNDEINQLHCFNKAAEMLWRTLPLVPEGAVFGVVLPRGFLVAKNLSDLREMILTNFELHQICCLPKKNIFLKAKHESVILFGRKNSTRLQQKHVKENKVLYRHISQEGLDSFKEKYEGKDQYVLQSKFLESPTFDLRLRELDEVWKYCENNLPLLDSIAEGGQGLIYKGKDLPQGAKTFDKKRFAGAVKGYVSFDRNISLHGLPEEYWMNLNPEVIRRPQWGRETGTPQIVMNYAPVGAGHWRLKALIEREGRPVSGRFLVFRPKNSDWSLNDLWGILNSPLVNAFIYAHTTDRDIPSGVVRMIPIPICTKGSLEMLEQLVVNYFALYASQGEILQPEIDSKEAKRRMLAIDAEVMRLYDLPPKLEWQLLNLFGRYKRKGVDFDFDRYCPEGFESWIPLHEYLSEEYQRSTPSFVNDWVEKNRSPEIIKAFETAVEAFKED
jgi:type I restriction-modification system DNA methylase subunit